MKEYFTHHSLPFTVVYAIHDADMPYQIPEGNLLEKVNQLYPRLFEEEGVEKAIEELEGLVFHHPDVPVIHNLLVAVFNMVDEWEKSNRLNDYLINRFPKYLYGWLNKVEEYINRGQLEKANKLLGSNPELNKFIPGRQYFHIDEFLRFSMTVIKYYSKTGELTKARSILTTMQEAAPEAEETQQALYWTATENFDNIMNRIQRDEANAVRVHSYPKRNEKPDAGPPNFHHKVIEELFKRGEWLLDEVYLEAIENLPEESVIQDLENVVRDSMERYELYLENDVWEEYIAFVPYAVHLLGDFKAYNSLPLVLDFLRQEEEFHNYWMDDINRDYLWMALYKLGNHKLDVLRNFILEKDNYFFPRYIVSSVAAQVALQRTERREEVIQWYESVLHYFIEHRNEKGLIDTELITFIVWALMDIGAAELKDTVTSLYRYFYIHESAVGDQEEVLAKISENQPTIEPSDILNTKELLWKLFEEEEDDEKPAMDNTPEISDSDIQPFMSVQPKVGRNDPCPCGSGKKYKNCCMEG